MLSKFPKTIKLKRAAHIFKKKKVEFIDVFGNFGKKWTSWFLIFTIREVATKKTQNCYRVWGRHEMCEKWQKKLQMTSIPPLGYPRFGCVSAILPAFLSILVDVIDFEVLLQFPLHFVETLPDTPSIFDLSYNFTHGGSSKNEKGVCVWPACMCDPKMRSISVVPVLQNYYS